MTKKEIIEYLCYYDKRNPNNVIDDDSAEEIKRTKEKACYCDSCFYGTHKLADALLEFVE